MAISCRAGRTVRGDQLGVVGAGEGVGDVDDDLAGQRVPVLSDDRHGAGVGHGEDDDVAGRGGAECPGRGPAAESGGQILGLGRVTADDLDGVASFDPPGADGAGIGPEADDADGAHDVCASFLWSFFWSGPRRARRMPASGTSAALFRACPTTFVINC